MLTKSRLKRLEACIPNDNLEPKTLIFCTVSNPNGTLTQFEISGEEYAKYHSEDEYAIICDSNNNGPISFGILVGTCTSVTCPWHGPLNKYQIEKGIPFLPFDKNDPLDSGLLERVCREQIEQLK